MTSGGSGLVKTILLPNILDAENNQPFRVTMMTQYDSLFKVTNS